MLREERDHEQRLREMDHAAEAAAAVEAEKTTARAARQAIIGRAERSAPVDFTVREGRLSVATTTPDTARPVEMAQRLSAQRQLVRLLIEEAAQKQLPQLIFRRFELYADALSAEAPTYILIDGPMAILRASLTDEFITGPLDEGFLAGWSHLIECHDRLRPYLGPAPFEDDDLPDPAPDTTPAQAEEMTDDAIAVMQEGMDQGAVDPNVIEALSAIRDYFEAAGMGVSPQPSLLKRGLIAIMGTLARVTQAVALPASVATLAGWAVTPQGQATIAKLAPIMDRLLAVFGY